MTLIVQATITITFYVNLITQSLHVFLFCFVFLILSAKDPSNTVIFPEGYDSDSDKLKMKNL